VWLIRPADREVGYRVVRRWGRTCRVSASGPALVTRTVVTRSMAERAGSTTTEAPGSHSIYVSRPDAVADLIRQAANAVATP